MHNRYIFSKIFQFQNNNNFTYLGGKGPVMSFQLLQVPVIIRKDKENTIKAKVPKVSLWIDYVKKDQILLNEKL